MKKTICTCALLLLAVFTAQAQLREGHFFKSLEDENISAEQAEQYFSQWFSLPAGTQWKQIGSNTDELGMSRIEYRQFVDDIEVEHSQILLHVMDGKVQTANGTVMEQQRTPQASAKVRRGSKAQQEGITTDLLGREVLLIDTNDGYRYAYKTLSANGLEWIYTDVETEEVLKRVPLVTCLKKPEGTATTAKGKSIFSGDVTLNVTKTNDGKTWLYDQERNIHTAIGAYLPTYTQMQQAGTYTTYFPQPPSEIEDVSKYLVESDFCSYAGNDGGDYSAYKAKTLTINTLCAIDILDDKIKEMQLPKEIDLVIRFGMDADGKASNGLIEKWTLKIDKLPFELDLSSYQEVIPREGVTIDFECMEEWNKKYSFTLKPDATGFYLFSNDYIMGSLGYEASSDPTVDIHWGMAKTYDFYKEVFNRKSYDGKGSPIYNFTYIFDDDMKAFLAIGANNAAAYQSYKPYPMIYGMGGWDEDLGKPKSKPVVELSVLSHEFTHIVTAVTAALEYQGEAGAINESFSDLMAISCKKWVEGNNASWVIGGKGQMITKPNMRDMANPKNSGDAGKDDACPDTYQGTYWVNTAEIMIDRGGIHTNSGVQNKWFYLLTDGGKGTNDKSYAYDVTGIGIEKSRQIAYRTLVQYATKQSQYADIRKASLQAAKDLYGANSTEVQTVGKAWDAVGVYENGDTPSGIRQIDQHPVANGLYYDLMGRPVSHPAHGIFILNGRKVVK